MKCDCLCCANHAQQGICDIEAPRTFVSIALKGSALEDLFDSCAERTIIMCRPCAEAFTVDHPRARGMVLLYEGTEP